MYRFQIKTFKTEEQIIFSPVRRLSKFPFFIWTQYVLQS